jgi:hypothetical protein
MCKVNIFLRDERFLMKGNFFLELVEWGKRLICPSASKSTHLSLSYRFALGYVVAGEGADFTNLKQSDLFCAKTWDFENQNFTIQGEGKTGPWMLLHAPVYRSRSSAIFCFYVENGDLVKSAIQRNLPMVSADKPLDEIDSLIQIENELGKGNLIRIGEKGVLAFGCTAEDAGGEIMQLLR